MFKVNIATPERRHILHRNTYFSVSMINFEQVNTGLVTFISNIW